MIFEKKTISYLITRFGDYEQRTENQRRGMKKKEIEGRKTISY